MKIGITDIGANTVRINIYEGCATAGYNLLRTEKEVAALAGHVKGGCLTPAGYRRLRAVVRRAQDLCKQMSVKRCHIFATASLRQVTNRAEILEAVYRETGMRIDVLSTEEEALSGFYAVVPHLAEKDGIHVDIGGGSTELTRFKDAEPDSTWGIPYGSLNLFEAFVAEILPDGVEAERIRKTIRRHLPTNPSPTGYATGIGGTIRVSGEIIGRASGLADRRLIARSDLTHFLTRVAARDRTAVHGILRYRPERIHTLIPGLLILDEILAAYGCTRFHVMNTGVREGYLIRTEGAYHG